jgi:hypothetical protein
MREAEQEVRPQRKHAVVLWVLIRRPTGTVYHDEEPSRLVTRPPSGTHTQSQLPRFCTTAAL